MKKAVLIGVITTLLFPAFIIAQAPEGPVAEDLGVDSAQQKLVEISVTKFEDTAYWGSSMSPDEGFVTVRRFEGSPEDKEPIEGEVTSNIVEQDKFVLGAKVEFIKRGKNVLSIFPVKPLPIEGITKTLSIWVVGRNYNHVLKVIIADYFGRKRELTFGKMNFMGWKKLAIAVPPHIIQDEYHFSSGRGIKLLGFKIDFDMVESFGTYYVYFDDMRAVTDLFAEDFRDTDDMIDGW
ncbi:putative flagellar filament outer layer-like protein [subsurface metagenome]